LFPSVKDALLSEDSAVKNKTALKQSIASVKFLALAIVAMLILAFKYPSGYTIVPLGFFAIFFFIDVMIPPYSAQSIARPCLLGPKAHR
jgi:hypothetical protein